MIGLSISCFIDINFVHSTTINLFLESHISYDLFFKSQVFQVCGIRHSGDFNYRFTSTCS